MKIYVTDIGDSSVGIQKLTIATLDLHESMIEVLEDENEMENFKKEFMALIDKYCAPEVSYDVYSDKDLEEEAKFEEEMMKEYCSVDVTATSELFKDEPKEPIYKKIYDARITAKAKLTSQSREEFEERKRKADVSRFETYGITKKDWKNYHNSKEK